MKVVTIVGARPQLIKAAAVSSSLRRAAREVLVHTGQHYDDSLSDRFFDELDIPAPDHHLGVGSGPHGAQTAAMLAALEPIMLSERPDRVLVYGDTNSTLAGALAAAKLTIPIVHVEAGLRSFNRSMPEEINRVITDRLSTLLCCPSDTAARNLCREGIVEGVVVTGDVMHDLLLRVRPSLDVGAVTRFGVAAGDFALLTLHRAQNTDDGERLVRVLDAIGSTTLPTVFPVHPRTRHALAKLGHEPRGSLRMVEPLGYRDLLALAQHARIVLTDSGGVQKEAYWLGVPCVTLRDETEWIETVDAGWNRLVGSDPAQIRAAMNGWMPPPDRPALYGDGCAADRITDLIVRT